jgi:hypothetical protein
MQTDKYLITDAHDDEYDELMMILMMICAAFSVDKCVVGSVTRVLVSLLTSLKKLNICNLVSTSTTVGPCRGQSVNLCLFLLYLC